MKLSINLSEQVYDRLGQIVKTQNSNASVVCEAALIAFELLEPAQRAQMLRELLAQRRPQTPSSWRALFWSALAEQFEVRDMAGGEQRYLMAPRTYRGFLVIYDAQHSLRPGYEDEIVVFTDTAPPYTDRTRRIGLSWKFRIDESVFEAARTVAKWIRENEAQLVEA